MEDRPLAQPHRRLVIALSAFNVALLAIFVAVRLAQPADGMRLQPGASAVKPDGVVLSALGAPPGGLQDGDKLIAIEGRSVESWAEALLCWRPLCAAPERPPLRRGGTLTYTVLRGGQSVDVAVRLGRYPLGANIRRDWGAMLYALVLLLVGVFVFIKRPDEPATPVLLMTGSSMFAATTWSFGLVATDFLQPPVFWLVRFTTYIIYLLIWIGWLHFDLIFPAPHRVLRRNPWLVPALYILPFVVHAATVAGTGLAATGVLDWIGRIGLDQNLTVMIYLLLGIAALATNYRDLPDTVSRQQIRVLVFAVGLIAFLAVVLWQIPQIITGEQWFTSSMMAILGLLMPAALVVSILRYRLWNIDVFINRSLVYGTLTVLIAGAYVLVVGTASDLLQQRASLLVSLMMTGVVAVIFQPLRGWLQRVVNRMMYGDRDDPYRVLSRLGYQLQQAATPDALLASLTETIATALKLPYVGIALGGSDEAAIFAEYGRPQPDPLILPLTYQDTVEGQLRVARRGRGEDFSPPDRQLLDNIARQAGMVVHAVRLTDDLQRSRERLVVAREEERRRLRRDLHDGLGPTLASQTLKLDAVLDLLEADPAQAEHLLRQIKAQSQATVADVRRLVYALRPPALDELGLAGALQATITSQTEGLPLNVDFRAEALPPLPAAVEVAAYRIVSEALNNVIQHAGADHCTISLGIDGARGLAIEVRDDGVGLADTHEPGVGLRSMQERAEELGGRLEIASPNGSGTCVRGWLPLGDGQ